jgi:hypothetical protein
MRASHDAAGVIRCSPEFTAEGVMGAAVAITCDDLDAAGLRCEAAQCRDADAARRMLALALVLDGRTRGEAAELCGLQAAPRPVPYVDGREAQGPFSSGGTVRRS